MSTPRPRHSLILYSAGPAWIAGKPIQEQPNIAAHGAFLQQLLDEGRLLLSGPFLEEPGGLAVLDVAEQAEAEAIAARDPAVVDGILAARVCAFRANRMRR